MSAQITSPTVLAVIEEYEAREQREHQRMDELPPEQIMQQRDQMLLSVGRATATLLNLLVKELQAKAVLEVGTSYGYSTVWLSEAAAAVGGKVTTLELDPSKVQYARAQIEKAGLTRWVEFRTGDALATLHELTGPFDLVLIDLWKELYIPSFDLIYRKLAPGAVVIADNMLQPETWRSQADAYREHVRTNKDMSSVLLPVGSGIEVSRYR